MKILIVSLVTFLLSSCYQTKKPPKIYESNYKDGELTQVQFYPYSITFDTLKAGQSFEGSFYIKNVGKNILYIDSISKACSCTKLDISKGVVNISDSLNVTFSIRPTVTKEYFVTPLVFYLNTKPFYRQILIEGYIE